MYSKRVKILLLFVTAVILATVVILQFLYQVKSNSEGKRIVQAIKNSKQIIPSWEHNKARVTITEFGNYLCSHCKQFDRDIVSRLEKDFKNNPQVQFQYIDVPFSMKYQISILMYLRSYIRLIKINIGIYIIKYIQSLQKLQN